MEPMSCTASLSAADSFDGSPGISPSPIKLICHFSCKKCGELAQEPVLKVICGHLFCRGCLGSNGPYSPAQEDRRPNNCPFCNSHLEISADGLTVFPVFPVYRGHVPDESQMAGEPIPKVDEEENTGPMPQTDEDDSKGPSASKKGALPRLVYNRYSYCVSQSACIIRMLTHFRCAKLYFRSAMYSCLRQDIFDKDRALAWALEEVENVVRKFQEGRTWLRGEELKKSPTRTNGAKKVGGFPGVEASGGTVVIKEQNFQIVLFPTIDGFSSDILKFSCGICKEIAYEPVVTRCGHLFCWTCIYHKITGGQHGCGVCSAHVNVFPSRGDINPRYYEQNDPHKENAILKNKRRNTNDGLLPCRMPSTVAAPFLDIMIDKIYELRDVPVKELTNLQPKNKEDIEKGLVDHWGNAIEDLLIKWRKITGEQTPDIKIRPCLLDNKLDKYVKEQRDGVIVYGLVRHVYDIIDN